LAVMSYSSMPDYTMHKVMSMPYRWWWALHHGRIIHQTGSNKETFTVWWCQINGDERDITTRSYVGSSIITTLGYHPQKPRWTRAVKGGFKLAVIKFVN
jgi:hypothetical protein